MVAETGNRRERAVLWVRRLGVAGFLFFLAKGLLWLAAGYLIGKGCL